MKKVLIAFITILLLSCSGKDGILDVTLREVNSGKKVRLAYYKFDYMVIYVWTGTCVGHEKDLKNLNDLKRKLGNNVKLVSLAVLMERDGVSELFKELNITPEFINLYDSKGNITEVVKLITLPSTLLIDKKGHIIKEFIRLPSSNLINKNIASKGQD